MSGYSNNLSWTDTCYRRMAILMNNGFTLLELVVTWGIDNVDARRPSVILGNVVNDRGVIDRR